MPILGSRGGASVRAFGRFATTAAPDTGVMFPLQVVTVVAATSSISFTNIPSTYKHLQIRYLARSARTSDIGATMLVQFNSDIGNNYAYHVLYGNGSSSPYAYNGSNTGVMRSYSVASSSSSNTQIYGVGIIDVLDYASTSKYKTLRHLGGHDRNGSGEINLASGLYQQSTITAISSITFTLAEATANYETNSHFALYGIKGAAAQ